MRNSNLTLRPSEHVAGATAHEMVQETIQETAHETAPGIASSPYAGRLGDDELLLPLSISPPLSLAPSQPAEQLSGSGISLRLHGDLNEVGAEWQALERHADRTVFQSFDWLAAWQRHIGARSGTVPAIVLGREADGQLLFILQLAVETHGLTRRLTWLGWQLCDYNAPLLAEHFSDHVSAERFALIWRDVIALLQADPRLRFDLVDLQKMPEAVGAQRNPFLDLPVFAHPSGAYVAHLGPEWEQFYAAKRSSQTRKKERRQLKHLAEFGEVRFVDVQNRDDIALTLMTLMEQKSRAFAKMGVEDFFARPGYREFFLDVACDPDMHEMIHVSRLDIGETTAATNVGLKFRDCYYLILSSYVDGDVSKFGPGRAHLHELMRHAIECGFQHFDFTVGDEPYKRDWSDAELRLYDHLAAVTLRGWMVTATTTAFRRTKRFIKQSPSLWHAFSKARALAGVINSR
jgi:CelD/BcsL family acetyltransferase involved in cellulose biosynthesis